MTQQTPLNPAALNLARQGNPGAIAYLITQALRHQGIVAKANLQGTCLRLLLEADHVPAQQATVRLLDRGIKRLGLQEIATVKIYGRQRGQTLPAWSQTLDLAHISVVDPAMVNSVTVDSVTVDFGALNPAFLGRLSSQSSLPQQTPAIAPNSSLEIHSSLEIKDSPRLASSQKTRKGKNSSFSTQPALLKRLNSSFFSPFFSSFFSSFLFNPSFLNRFLVGLFGVQVGLNSLSLLSSSVGAVSYAFYTQSDLTETTRIFANELYILTQAIDYLSSPLDLINQGVQLLMLLVILVWLYRLHVALRSSFQHYPIKPWGAIVRYIIPLYNLWGIWTILITLANCLKVQSNSLKRQGKALARLIPWLYLFIIVTSGLKGDYYWQSYVNPNITLSPWFFVLSDAVSLGLSLSWFLVIWRIDRSIAQLW